VQSIADRSREESYAYIKEQAAAASMAGKGFNQWSTARRLVLVAIMLLMEVCGRAWMGGGQLLGRAGWTRVQASSSI